MNKVDQHIKQMMLQYPSIYPNRLACIRQLFLVNGNGYDWDNDGCLVPWRSPYDRASDRMHYDDIEPNDSVTSLLGKDSSIGKFHALSDVKERMDRQFREEHIDLLCQFHDTYDNFRYEHLVNFDVAWSAFRDAPYGSIDADWLAVMEETVNKIMYSFNIIWGMHYDNPLKGEKLPEPSMFSRMPERWQKLYTDMKEVEAKLEAQSGSKARAMKFWNSIKDDVLNG